MFQPFTASVVAGAGRGKALGSPTINLDPSFLTHIGHDGIYSCWATLDGMKHAAVMHAGPRPVFRDTPAIEIHLLDGAPETIPQTVTVEGVKYLREIRDFPSIEALQEQIRQDVAAARATVGVR